MDKKSAVLFEIVTEKRQRKRRRGEDHKVNSSQNKLPAVVRVKTKTSKHPTEKGKKRKKKKNIDSGCILIILPKLR